MSWTGSFALYRSTCERGARASANRSSRLAWNPWARRICGIRPGARRPIGRREAGEVAAMVLDARPRVAADLAGAEPEADQRLDNGRVLVPDSPRVRRQPESRYMKSGKVELAARIRVRAGGQTGRRVIGRGGCEESRRVSISAIRGAAASPASGLAIQKERPSRVIAIAAT